jgi:hypothetical protein
MPIDIELMPIELREEQEHIRSEQPPSTDAQRLQGESGAVSAAEQPNSAAAAVDGAATEETATLDQLSSIIVFYNSKSGGQMGKIVNHAMRSHLSDDRCVLLLLLYTASFAPVFRATIRCNACALHAPLL